MATDDPSGGQTSGQQPPQADASPREGTSTPAEKAGEAGERARRRPPPPTIDLPAKDLTPPEEKVAVDEVAGESAAADETGEAAVAEERAAEERAAEEKAAYLHTEAGAGGDAASEAPPAPPPAETPRRSLGVLAGLIIALISGLIGGAIAAMVVASFFGPTENIDSLTDLEARTVELRQRTDALEARPQAGDPSAAVAALGQRLDALTTTLDGVAGKVSALESAPAAAAPAGEAPAAVSPELNARLDAVEALAKQAREANAAPAAPSPELTARLDAVEALAKQASAAASSAAERPTVSPDALSTLGDKLTALEQRVAAVAKANEVSAKGAAQLAALGSLREAVLRGAPFAAELAAARSLLGPAGDVLQPLDIYAAAGFPSGAILLKRLTEAKAEEPVAPAASPAAEAPAAPADEGFFARLTRSAEGLVSVRKVDEAAPAAAGEATEAGYDRVAAALSRDDMAGAAREIEALPAKAREAAQPVAADLAARSKALADIDTLNRQILAGLAGSAP